MRVGMYYNNRDVRVEEMSRPGIGPGEMLVKVIASGICGSDVLEWYRVKKAPRVLGHEIAGEIVELGEGVDNYKVGQRVFVSHHIPCNTCHYCLKGYHTACETLHTTNYDPGGFSEYIRVPRLNVDRGVFVLPDEVSYKEGTFVEPLGCVLRGQRVARFQPGDSVLILGAGISGLLHLAAARALGAGRIMATDINEYRLKAAKDLGADAVLDVARDIRSDEDVPAWVRQVNKSQLVDLAIVCTGALSAFKQALKSVDRGGTVMCFATTEPDVEIPVPMNEFWRNEIKLMPSYGNAPLDARIAIELIRCKRIPLEQMITHCLPLDKIALGFQLVAEAGESIKVIIEPHK
ncbi:MAG: alcohol dehydrogenase catalytic domain-containing protein [Candidatus Aminicenantes bacterium]|nr:MAG: alcohol dehydrogenase catalytic domain-containing protein [Candidatus Aminicenantes bacterium]